MSEEFLSSSESKDVSPSHKSGCWAWANDLDQGGSSSPGMNLTSHAGMCRSNVAAHAEMSQDDVSGNPMPCLIVARAEGRSGLLQASDEARKDMTSVSSVDAFHVQMNRS